MLNVVDEFTRECLAIRVDRRLRSTDVIDVLICSFYAAFPVTFVQTTSYVRKLVIWRGSRSPFTDRCQ
jgi:hypothetical protein